MGYIMHTKLDWTTLRDTFKSKNKQGATCIMSRNNSEVY